MLTVDFKIKRSFWLFPYIRVLYWLTITRILPLNTAAKWMTFACNRAHKLKIGNGEWQRLEKEIEITLERQ